MGSELIMFLSRVPFTISCFGYCYYISVNVHASCTEKTALPRSCQYFLWTRATQSIFQRKVWSDSASRLLNREDKTTVLQSIATTSHRFICRLRLCHVFLSPYHLFSICILHSCFEKGTKVHATMPTGITGSNSLALLGWGSRYLI